MKRNATFVETVMDHRYNPIEIYPLRYRIHIRKCIEKVWFSMAVLKNVHLIPLFSELSHNFSVICCRLKRKDAKLRHYNAIYQILHSKNQEIRKNISAVLNWELFFSFYLRGNLLSLHFPKKLLLSQC